MATVTVVEAANVEEEALAIAVALREALTSPTHTAALVTPDRALARRVAVTLRRCRFVNHWSSGDALASRRVQRLRGGAPKQPGRAGR
jgi:ATP-dependent helicase/nuclease subunit B